MKKYLASIMLVAIFPAVCLAQSEPAPDFECTFGAGLVGISGVYVDQKDELFAFPLFSVSYKQFTLGILEGVQYRAVETENTNISFSLVYDLFLDRPDTTLFAGLDRKDTVSFEVAASHNFGVFDISGSVKRDILNKHEGLSAEVSVGRSILIKSVHLEGRAGASYLDGNYGSYLYGIGINEANSLRNAFTVDPSWSPFVQLSAAVPVIDDSTTLVGSFRHVELSKEISNSPLVGAGERTWFGLTIARRF
jgi:outer membrane scaffolding protein for murein synthesis (MipA/OmpV family)